MSLSPTLNCNNIIEDRVKNNQIIYNFGLGANPIKQPRFYINSLQEFAHKKEYTSAEGIPSLNNTLKSIYSKNKSVNKILLGNGLKELLYIIQLAFTGKIIHITPSWVSYKEQILIMNKESNLIELPTTLKDNYKLDLQLLENTLIQYNDFNKLLLFNNPNNPLGISYTNEEIRDISILLKKYKCVVVADEIYLNLTFDNDIKSISDYIPELTIIGSSVSKDLGCGGYRLGWLVFPQTQLDLFNKCNSYASSIYSSPSTPIQYATNKMLLNETIIKEHHILNNTIYKYISGELCNMLLDSNIQFIKPNSAWYVFLNFDNYKDRLELIGCMSSYDLSLLLINKCGIINVAGDSFNTTGLNIRLSFIDFMVDNSTMINPETDIDISKMKAGIHSLLNYMKSI